MRFPILIGLSFCAILNSCAYFSRKYYTNPEQLYDSLTATDRYDAIIVPGFPHFKDSTTLVIYQRVNWAVYLYQKGITQNIIFSGGAVHTPFVESKIMALYAEKMGVPPEHIFIEDQAEHSTENVYYSSRLGMRNGFERFAVATDVVQSSFLYSINNHRFEMEVDFLPIVMDSLNKYAQALPYIAQDSALQVDFVPLKERESFLKRLWGTRGQQVKKKLKAERKAAKLHSNEE